MYMSAMAPSTGHPVPSDYIAPEIVAHGLGALQTGLAVHRPLSRYQGVQQFPQGRSIDQPREFTRFKTALQAAYEMVLEIVGHLYSSCSGQKATGAIDCKHSLATDH